MKKILLATSALVASAGIASADMTISGDARMGVSITKTGAVAAVAGTGTAAQITTAQTAVTTSAATATTGAATLATAQAAYDATVALGTTTAADVTTLNAAKATQQGLVDLAALDTAALDAIDGTAAVAGTSTSAIVQRMRVKFTGSGETDGGIAFGADMELSNSAIVGNSKVWISSDFGKLSVGRVDTAADTIVGNISSVGLTGHGSRMSHIGGASILYEYSSNGLSFAAAVGSAGTSRDASIGIAYATGDYSFGLGWAKDNSAAIVQTSAFAKGTFGTTSAKLVIEKTTALAASYGVSVDSDLNGLDLTAFVWRVNGASTNYGIGASYDLGGGAVVKGGYSRVGASGNSVLDLGLALTF